MASTDTNIVSDSHITVLSSPHSHLLFVLRVDYVEHFACFISQRFQNDVVFLRLLHLYDIDDLVIERDLKRKHGLA